MLDGYVQSKLGKINAGSSNPMTFTNTPRVGAAVVVVCMSFDHNWIDGDVTDNQGNTYTRIFTINQGGSDYMAYYYCASVKSSGTFTITTNGTNATAIILEYAGLNSASQPDTNTSNSALPGTNPNSGQINMGFPGVVITSVWQNVATNDAIITSPFNLRESNIDNNNFEGLQVADTVLSPQSVTAQWTSSSNVNWQCAIVSFKSSANKIIPSLLRPRPFTPGTIRGKGIGSGIGGVF